MAQRLLSEIIAGRRPLIAPLDMTVRDAVQWMVGENRAAILVERDGRLAGIFTEHDALSRVLAEGRHAETTHLHEVMTRNPVALEPGRRLLDALNLMRQFGFRHVPVVDKGEPLGVVSLRDVLETGFGRFESEMAANEPEAETGAP